MTKVKYPRTFHMPSSKGATSDDKILPNLDSFVGSEVVITEKLDGENSTLYHDYYHARSIDSRHHPSRNWLKSFHGSIAYKIPPELRICGENMYAQHSIMYSDLDSYFYGFSIWDRTTNECLDWDSTVLYLELLGIVPVKVLYKGMFDQRALDKIISGLDLSKQEGVVMRKASSFLYDDFSNSVCKWVRSNHVTTDTHWAHTEIRPNILKNP